MNDPGGRYMNQLDPDGQPYAGINFHARVDRDLSELLGFAKGILLDGVVSEEEVNALSDWLQAHPAVTAAWPGARIAQRVEAILADGIVSESERDDLRELLQMVVGGDAGIVCGENASCVLPLDDPPPNIVFPGKVFTLTGKFVMAPRKVCVSLTEAAGGVHKNQVSSKTNYLIIGTLASRDWIHTSWGRKIEEAVEQRNRRDDIHIVGEDVWADALPAID